jgi:hypothetical protein
MVQATLSPIEGAPRAIPLLNKEISEKFQSLLETKHLYQKVTVEWEKVVAALKEPVMPGFWRELLQYIRGVPHMPFVLATQIQIARPPLENCLGHVQLSPVAEERHAIL